MSAFSLFGVNLSGAEYDPGGTLEGTNYTYPTDAEIDYYASKGMTVIRLPFLLERVEPVPGGPLSTTELGYIDNVVDYAASKGIDVILDPHDYGDEYGTVIGTTAASNATFANFWGELASHFASTSNVLFGLMNEPNAVTPTQWLASANAAIAAIRGAGATTQQILVPGTDWDGADTWVSSGNAQVLGSGIVDPSHNFAFEVHQYLDADGSGTSSTVVSTEIGVERLTAITQWAEATGNKLFLGEFGVASDATSLTALNNMLGYMAQHTDVWEGGTYWAGGPWLGNYMYSTEPTNGVDKPQMGILEQYVPTAIESAGSASLTEFGTNFYFDNISTSTGPELNYGGSPVVAGQIPGWTPIGAEQLSGGGYDVAWKDAGANLYSVWQTDSNGNFVAIVANSVPGNSNTLESLESIFHQDLNGDGVIDLPTTVIEATGDIVLNLNPLTQAATIDAAAKLELTGADSASVTFNGATGSLILDHSSLFSGTVFNFTGDGNLSSSDQIDLKDIAFGAGTTVSYTGTSSGGTLTVSDAENHTAHIALAGDYTSSTFSLSNDGSGGTVVIDPAAKQDVADGTLSFGDAALADKQTVGVAPQNGGAGYVGNFTVDAVNAANWQDSVGWHFNFDSSPVSETVTQSYDVAVTDNHADGTHSSATQSVSATIAGPGNDAFVFHPGVGSETIVNAASADTIELDGFSSVTNSRQLAQLLSEAQAGHPQSLFAAANGGHDTVINLGNHDVITLTNVQLAELHASNFIIG
jgi:endoglucanase